MEDKTGPPRAKDGPGDDETPNMSWFARQSKQLDNFYPGPTIMMHKLHWTEWVFILLVAGSAALTMVGAMGMVSVAAICGFQACSAVTGLMMVWNIAKYQNMAKAASALEEQAMANHAAVSNVQAVNDQWEDSNKAQKANLEEFTSGLGLMTDDSTKIDDIVNTLTKLVVNQRRIKAEEKVHWKIGLEHFFHSRSEITEKQRTIMKTTLGRLFDRLDRLENKSVQLNEIKSPESVAQMEVMMADNEFLNTPKKDGTTFNWRGTWKDIVDDGVIEKFELLDALDGCTESYFEWIRESTQPDQMKKLNKELLELNAKLVGVKQRQAEMDDAQAG